MPSPVPGPVEGTMPDTVPEPHSVTEVVEGADAVTLPGGAILIRTTATETGTAVVSSLSLFQGSDGSSSITSGR